MVAFSREAVIKFIEYDENDTLEKLQKKVAVGVAYFAKLRLSEAVELLKVNVQIYDAAKVAVVNIKTKCGVTSGRYIQNKEIIALMKLYKQQLPESSKYYFGSIINNEMINLQKVRRRAEWFIRIGEEFAAESEIENFKFSDFRKY